MATPFVPLLHPPADDGDGTAEQRWFYVRGDDVLVTDAQVELPLRGRHFLGLLGGRPCWAGDVEPPESGPDVTDTADGSFMPLRALWGRLDETEWTIAGRAVQLVEWDRTHRFCGRCGEGTAPVANERARRCPRCGLWRSPVSPPPSSC